MTKHPRIGRATSIIKLIGNVLVVTCLLISLILPITATAAQEYLVTLLLIPDGTFDYTDYDSAYLTIMSNKTGKSYHYTLYPYNNFSDKVSLPEGEYTVIEAGMNGRADMIFEFEANDVTVNRSVAVIVKLKDSKIIKQNTTTATTKATTVVTQTTGTTKPEIPTLFSIPGGNISDVSETNTEITETTAISTTLAAKETTTAKSSNLIADNSSTVIPLAIIIAILTLVIIAFFIALRKKNKSD